MVDVKAAKFFLFLAFIFTFSQSLAITPQPEPLKSLKIHSQDGHMCDYSYTVRITTSCSSTPHTRDRISLAFGDAYGNQVHVPRLDDPASGTFESCSRDIFQIEGPCTYGICYLYLYRSGYDGWKPSTVTIYGYHIKTITFTYDTFIPNGIWYGFNFCDGASASS